MRTKKVSSSVVTIIVLSVLLVLSVTTAATLAWFASFDTAVGFFTLGDAVTVSVTDATGSDTDELSMTISSEMLLPGMKIIPNIAVSLQPSNTATILRARIDTLAEFPGEANSTPIPELNTIFRGVLTPVISGSWVLNEDDGWYYYLGEGGQDARVMTTTAEASTLTAPEFGSTLADYGDALTATREMQTDVVLASVVSGATVKTLPFLTNAFRLPTSITNEYAQAQIKLDFIVEAVQDYLIINNDNVLPELDNAITVFEEITEYVAQ